jgi:predicted ribosomally synthesized peptide with nif11-like leader
MAKRDLARFFLEYLGQRPDLRRQIEAIRDDVGIARALVEEGRRAGFDFSEVEVLDAMEVPKGGEGGELSASELQAVAGGRRAGGDPLKYMEIKLKEVRIS